MMAFLYRNILVIAEYKDVFVFDGTVTICLFLRNVQTGCGSHPAS